MLFQPLTEEQRWLRKLPGRFFIILIIRMSCQMTKFLLSDRIKVEVCGSRISMD